jgi:CRISPR-associated protein Cmr2
MIYDWHARHRITDKQTIDRVTNGRDEFGRTTADTRVRLLAQAVVTDDKAYAQSGERNKPAGMKLLIHTQKTYDHLTGQRLSEMGTLGLRSPEAPINRLPIGSWFLRIDFTLAKPYASRDDEAFYIIDNPLKKEKVFSVPYIAPASWKGNLRWTTMYLRIALPFEKKKQELLDSAGKTEAQKEREAYAVKLAEERMRQTLLFGSEQGWQEERADGWTKYLDDLLGPSAAKKYRESLREHFEVDEDKPVPHSQGRLQFFPTYLDKIDLEVINPHDRKTRTGRQPIYFEVSPAGAKGVFNLLYLPFDLVGDEEAMRKAAQNDLVAIIEGVRGMLCDYGFSAKKSSGFGVADPNSISGKLQVNDPRWEEPREEWEGFEKLTDLAREWAKAVREKGDAKQ